MKWEEFAAERGRILTAADDDMRPVVTAALANWGETDWWSPVVSQADSLWLDIFTREAPDADPQRFLSEFNESLGETLRLTTNPENAPAGQIERVTEYVGTAAVNDATYRAGRATRALGMRWISMRDSDVRPAHRATDGQIVSIRGTFNVGGERLRFPGDPRGSLPNIMQCRCILQVIRRENAVTASSAPDLELDEDLDEEELDLPDEVPWHGVLAPMGVASGDRRMFAEGALSHRDLPLPMKYASVTGPGHDGGVPAARIDRIEYYPEDNPRLALGYGAIVTRHEAANDVIAGLVDGTVRGISVDVDDYHEVPQVFEIDDDMDDAEIQEMMANAISTADRARIMGAHFVDFPAFPEAFAALGEDFQEGELDMILARLDGDMEKADAILAACVPCQARHDEDADEEFAEEFRDYTPGERRKLAESGAAMEDGSYPIVTVEDLRNAIQAIGRAKDREATIAHIKKRAKALGETELIPESWAVEDEALVAAGVDAEDFARGPGWITNPKETARLHRYWTRGKGAAKIRWGEPHDFYRCRRQLAKYINPIHLNSTCAQWHHDAIGIWPGQHDAHSVVASGEAKPAFTVVAGGFTIYPAEWFKNPEFSAPHPITVVEEDGRYRIFGTAAQWSECHIGIQGRCTEAPHSNSDYAHYAVGQVETTEGPVYVGQITMDTGHAKDGLSSAATIAHYDNTGTVVADVAIGEDAVGIWVAGVMRPGVTQEQVEAIRACGKVSGDWRNIQGDLEMVALLAVNTRGFSFPRTSLAASGDVQLSLVAAGVPDFSEEAIKQFDAEKVADLVVEKLDARETRSQRIARAAETLGSLHEREKADRLKRVDELIGGRV